MSGVQAGSAQAAAGALVAELLQAEAGDDRQRHLQAIKRHARQSDGHLEAVFQAVWSALLENSSQKRLAALEVCAVLFDRSRVFRDLLTDRFPRFVDLVVAARSSTSLPPPRSAAKDLRTAALAHIQAWDARFGQHYAQLGLACRYVRDIAKLRVDGAAGSLPRSNGAAQAAAQRRTDARTQAQQQQQQQSTVLAEYPAEIEHVRVCVQLACSLLDTLGHPMRHNLRLLQQLQAADANAAATSAAASAPTGAPSENVQASAAASEPPGEAASAAGGEGTSAAVSEGEGGLSDEEWEMEDAGGAEGDADGAYADGGLLTGFDVAEVVADQGDRNGKRRRAAKGAHRTATLEALREVLKWIQTQQLPRIASWKGALDGEPPPTLHDTDQAAVRAASEQLIAAQDALQAVCEHVSASAELTQELQDVAVTQSHQIGGSEHAARPRRLRGRNERLWDEDAARPLPSVPAKDYAAANLRDKWTVMKRPAQGAAAAPQAPTSSSAAAAAVSPSSASRSLTTAAIASSQAVRNGQQGSNARKSTIAPEALASILARAPVLPAGPYLKLWESREAQLEYIKQSIPAGQIYNHWGRVEEDVEMDPSAVEDMLAYRAVFTQPAQPAEKKAAAKREAEPKQQQVAQGAADSESAPNTPAAAPAVDRASVQDTARHAQQKASTGDRASSPTDAEADEAAARAGEPGLGDAGQSRADVRASERAYFRDLMAQAGMSAMGHSTKHSTAQKKKKKKAPTLMSMLKKRPRND